MVLHLIILCILTFVLSFICGYFRFRYKRLSFYWFLFIHLPIPFVWATRYYFNIPLLSALPFTVACFAAGQWLGLRYAERCKK